MEGEFSEGLYTVVLGNNEGDTCRRVAGCYRRMKDASVGGTGLRILLYLCWWFARTTGLSVSCRLSVLMAPSAAKSGPKSARRRPRRGPRSALDSPRGAEGQPKGGPRATQKGPSGPWERPRDRPKAGGSGPGAPEAPRRVQCAARALDKTSLTSPRRRPGGAEGQPKRVLRVTESGPRGPR